MRVGVAVTDTLGFEAYFIQIMILILKSKISRYWTDLRRCKNGQSENGLPVVLLKI